MLVLSLAALTGGCNERHTGEDRTMVTDKQARVQLCGESIIVDTTVATARTQNEQLIVDISLDQALKGDHSGRVHSGSVNVLMHCGDSGGTWERADVSAMRWDAVIARPEIELQEYRRSEGRDGYLKTLAFAPVLDAYRKPDGSPFVIVCRVQDDWRPVQCEVLFTMGRLHVSYAYLGEAHLKNWKEIDGIVRSVIKLAD